MLVAIVADDLTFPAMITDFVNSTSTVRRGTT